MSLFCNFHDGLWVPHRDPLEQLRNTPLCTGLLVVLPWYLGVVASDLCPCRSAQAVQQLQ